MSIGIRTTYRQAANQSVAASVALTNSTNLVHAIAANQIVHVRLFLVFNVGAAGGLRLQINAPAGLTAYYAMGTLTNTVAPSTAPIAQTAPAAFTNALANAGNHFVQLEVDVTNAATAGNITVQFAQNTSDATAVVLLRGSFMECTTGPLN